MKIYYLDIDAEDLGLSAVSLVEQPAIRKNFLLFNDIQQRFNIDTEKKELLGIVMLADTPIYRFSQDMGEYYVVFTKEQIKKIVQKFSKDKLLDSVTLDHINSTEGVYMFESYLVDKSLGINPPKGFQDIPDGSWVARYKIDNEDVWKDIKSGTFKGFSVEGLFGLKEKRTNFNEEFLKEVYKILK